MFARNLGTGLRQAAADDEDAIDRHPSQAHIGSILGKVDEEAEPAEKVAEPVHHEIQDISKEITNTSNIEDELQGASDLEVITEFPMDAIDRQTSQAHIGSILGKVDEEAEPAEKVTEPVHHEIQDISKEITITSNIEDELQGASDLEVITEFPMDAIDRQTSQAHIGSILGKVDEEAEPAEKVAEPVHHEIQDISKEITITSNIEDELQGASDLEVITEFPMDAIDRQTSQAHIGSILGKVDEEAEPAEKVTEPVHHEIQDISKEITITSNIEDELQGASDLEVITEFPIIRTSQADDINEPAPKRQRRSGYVSYKRSQQLKELSNNTDSSESHKEKTIDFEKRQRDMEPSTATSSSVEAGSVTVSQESGRNGSDTSESPLGGGDSQTTTDSITMDSIIREEWGTEGTMHKIYQCVKEGVNPLNVHYLLSRSPTVAGHSRLIAAHCFNSILKLKKHGFINVIKNSETNEIEHISLGSRITRQETS